MQPERALDDAPGHAAKMQLAEMLVGRELVAQVVDVRGRRVGAPARVSGATRGAGRDEQARELLFCGGAEVVEDG